MTAVLHRTTLDRHRRHTSPGPRPALTSRPLSSARPSAATYRRRRVVVGTALAVFVAVGVVTAHDVLAGSGGVPASAAVSLPAQARQRVVAQRRRHAVVDRQRPPRRHLDHALRRRPGRPQRRRHDPGRPRGRPAVAATGPIVPSAPAHRRRRPGMGQYPVAVHCPSCQADDTKVVDSRLAEEGGAVRRRRQCLTCSYRFTTFERVEEVPLVVVKSDGSTQPFDREKIAFGVRAACKGRSVTEEQIEQLAEPSRTSCGCRGARSARAGSGSPCSTACACSTRSPTCASPASTRTSTPPPTSRASSSCSASSGARPV